MYRKLQQHSTAPTYNPTLDALHTDTDSPRSNSTELEPSPEGSTVPVAERPKISPEIPETPTGALENMQREEDNDSDDGNTPSHLCSRSSTETVDGGLTVASDGGLNAEEGRSFVRDRPHNDNDTFSVETSQLQRAGQIELVVNTNSSNEASVSIAQCSD